MALSLIPTCLDSISRSYGDLWHLRLDLPGGHFEGVDVGEEARTGTLGPWRRCFGCGGVG